MCFNSSGSNNNYEIVELLLYAGADTDKQNILENTALIIAAFNDARELVELLLDYHADEFVLDNSGRSFYDYDE